MDYSKYPDLTVGISNKSNVSMGPNEYAYAINQTAKIQFSMWKLYRSLSRYRDNSAKEVVTNLYLDILGNPRITIIQAPMTNRIRD